MGNANPRNGQFESSTAYYKIIILSLAKLYENNLTGFREVPVNSLPIM